MSSLSISFRKKHLLQLLYEYETQTGPIDYFVSCYFREHKALGSKDRAYISETLYALIRWQGLLDFLTKDNPSWERRLRLLEERSPQSYLQDTALPLHIRLSFPQDLFAELETSWGQERAKLIALSCNEAAPTTVRVNLLKTTRDELLKLWKEKGFSVAPCASSKAGILFYKKINFFSLPEFQAGLFEVQDEASQEIANLMGLKQGDRAFDFCAGAGGKTLAFAEKLQGSGQIYLHDIRLRALHEARKRLKRAGIQNAQIIHSEEKDKLKKLKKQMDWIFVDAPCSGTGTLRRNPDMKWKFTKEMIERLVGEQRAIFEQALSYLKPTGKIIYATCSILQKENQDQVDHFLKTYPLELDGSIFQSIPESGKKDGFFAAIFKFK